MRALYKSIQVYPAVAGPDPEYPKTGVGLVSGHKMRKA